MWHVCSSIVSVTAFFSLFLKSLFYIFYSCLVKQCSEHSLRIIFKEKKLFKQLNILILNALTLHILFRTLFSICHFIFSIKWLKSNLSLSKKSENLFYLIIIIVGRCCWCLRMKMEMRYSEIHFGMWSQRLSFLIPTLHFSFLISKVKLFNEINLTWYFHFLCYFGQFLGICVN
jgi:hypothetical protein